ncbi:MAG: hypothetical protein ACTSRL_22935 [Candidatus Helarchaeota archaeon]
MVLTTGPLPLEEKKFAEDLPLHIRCSSGHPESSEERMGRIGLAEMEGPFYA